VDFDYDILIVGAGPAGCAAAYDLAHAGKRALLLDKRSFPRHKACACGLTRKTLKALRYSVDPVIERECRDVVLQEAGAGFAEGSRIADKDLEVRVHMRQPFCAMAVRERFDDFCLQQTLMQGAEFRKMEGIVAMRELPTHVEVEVAAFDGGTETFTAPVMLGADGSNGQTRRLAEGVRIRGYAQAAALPPEPEWYARGFALEATVPFTSLPERLPAGDRALDLVFDFAPIAGGYGWLFPKGDHINIGVGGFVPQSQSEAAAGTPGMHYETVTRALLADYTSTKLGIPPPANVTGQYLGLGGHAYVPSGRVLLAGDAAGMVDPLTGEGIHSAIVSGQAAAKAVAACLRANEGYAKSYARNLQRLQETLAFSYRAARSFYREPGRGFRVMRTPMLRGLVLKTYADGLPHTRLLASLVKRVA
jgi:geranylgeranyl reductase family protein